MRQPLVLLCALACTFCFCPAAHADVKLTPVLSGLSQPVFVTHAGEGSNRLFIVEKTGRIKVRQPGASTATTFLNISTKVAGGSEQGLLGLAFHPGYASNRRFFVNYTRRSDGATIVAEYTANATNPNLANTTERVLLTIAQPFANHNGGMIAFGPSGFPSGFLYIGMGDGGSANDPGDRAQNINSLLGKMLRIDVDHTQGALPYAIPDGNPFAGAVPGRDEIFALGFRNPWRFSFDRRTGEIWCGDVGQNAWEEIDIVTRGGNYGWRVFEGTHCTNLDPDKCDDTGFIAPVYEYPHIGDRCSVTGGYVYRGRKASFLDGAYIFADFCSGELFQLRNGVFKGWGDLGLSPSSFGEDEAGELYVTSLSGDVKKIEAVGLRISNVRLREGNDGTKSAVFSVTLNRTLTQTVRFNYRTEDRSATAGSDYVAQSGTLSIGPEHTIRNISVTLRSDTLAENDETFAVRLSNVSGADLLKGTGVCTILNDDSIGAAPRNVNASPSDATTAPESAQSFVATYSDADGASDIAVAYLHAGSSLSAAGVLRCYYNPATHKLYVRNDDDTAWLGGFAPGSDNVISNSQGSLNCAQTSVVASGTLLTVNWNLTPSRAWAGTSQSIFLFVRDKASQQDGWDHLSQWTITQ